MLWIVSQLDSGMYGTFNRKLLTLVPVALFVLATHGTEFRKQPLGLNLAMVLLLLVAKLPALHKVRFFGINRVGAASDFVTCCLGGPTYTWHQPGSFLNVIRDVTGWPLMFADTIACGFSVSAHITLAGLGCCETLKRNRGFDHEKKGSKWKDRLHSSSPPHPGPMCPLDLYTPPGLSCAPGQLCALA